MRLVLQTNDKLIAAVAAKRASRRIVSATKAKYKRKKCGFKGKMPRVRLLVPFALNITGDKNRSTFLKFLEKLRESVFALKARVVLDFSEADVLMPSAVLLFVAELDRLKRLRPSTFRVTLENVAQGRVEQVLQQVGIYSLCEVEKRHLKEEERFDETVKHWRYATGTKAGHQSNQAFEEFEGRLARDLAKDFWKSYSEAIVNSAKHAYVEARFAGQDDLPQPRWWMFSQEKDGELTVAICDLGIGIPRSLPRNWEPSLIGRIFAKYQGDGPDVQAVRAAMEVGATSTKEAHRGKGLAQIYNTLRKTPGARVVLYSNKARLAWNAETGDEISFEHERSINGTLILWVVKIAGDDEE